MGCGKSLMKIMRRYSSNNTYILSAYLWSCDTSRRGNRRASGRTFPASPPRAASSTAGDCGKSPRAGTYHESGAPAIGFTCMKNPNSRPLSPTRTNASSVPLNNSTEHIHRFSHEWSDRHQVHQFLRQSSGACVLIGVVGYEAANLLSFLFVVPCRHRLHQ